MHMVGISVSGSVLVLLWRLGSSRGDVPSSDVWVGLCVASTLLVYLLSWPVDVLAFDRFLLSATFQAHSSAFEGS